MILFPLQIDSDGDLLHSNDPLDILASEAYSFLDTAIYTRPLRIDYGSKTYVLTQIQLGTLMSELTLSLTANMPAEFGQISVSVDSSVAQLQAGVVSITINFTYNNQPDSLDLQLSLTELANKAPSL